MARRHHSKENPKQPNAHTMKTKLTTLLTTALLGLALASCSTTGGAKPYPYDVCIVSGNKLGSMGTPITKVHEGQQIKFCCEPCVEEFDENPAKFMTKLPK
jgi:YHS domain-containing protein